MLSGWTVATRALSGVLQRLVLGRRLDVRPARDLDRLGLVLGRRREDVAVVDVRLQLGHLEQLGRVALLARVADLAVEHRHRRHRRRAEVDLVLGRARATREVAVEGAQRVRVRGRRLAHADARPADRLEHPHAALDELAVDARPRRSPRGSGASPAWPSPSPLVHLAAVAGRQHRARQGEVEVGRVHRRADADLLDRRARRPPRPARRCPGSAAWPRAGRARRGRSRRARRTRSPASGASSAKSSSRCWRRSHSRVLSSGGKTAAVAPSSAIMLAIVARSGTARSAVPGPVNSKTLFLPPRTRQAPQQLEDHVLGLDPGAVERVVEMHLHDLRAGDLVGMSGHRDRHVEAAGADGDHAERAARGGVRVGAHEDAARPGVALDVHVVADAVAGARVVDAVAAAERLQHAVVVGVLEVELDHVVVHVLERRARP